MSALQSDAEMAEEFAGFPFLLKRALLRVGSEAIDTSAEEKVEISATLESILAVDSLLRARHEPGSDRHRGQARRSGTAANHASRSVTSSLNGAAAGATRAGGQVGAGFAGFRAAAGTRMATP